MNARLIHRRPLAAACLVAAPLALLAGSLVRPSVPHGDGSQVLAKLNAIAAHRSAETAAIWLLALAWFLMVPACIVILRWANEHRSRLVQIGSSLFLLSVLAKIADIVFKPMLLEMTYSPDRAEMARVVNRIQEESIGKVLIVALIVGFAFGVPLLAAGFRQAGQLQTPLAVVLGVAGVLLFPGQFFEIQVLGILSAGLLIVGLTAVSLRCLGPSVDQFSETRFAKTAPLGAGR